MKSVTCCIFRLANQRILELESQLEEVQTHQATASMQEGTELRQKLNSSLAKIKDLESEVKNKCCEIEQHENVTLAKSKY